MEKQQLIKFWIKFFDNGLRGTVPKEDYMMILEQLVRGSTLNKPSKTTIMFAKMFKKMMQTREHGVRACIVDAILGDFENKNIFDHIISSPDSIQPLMEWF